MHMGWAKAKLTMAPILTPLLSVQGPGSHFRCWHCYLGISGPTGGQDGHPYLAMTHLLGYQDSQGSPWNLSLAFEAPTNLASADFSGFIT